jgi:hypothetical protein
MYANLNAFDNEVTSHNIALLLHEALHGYGGSISKLSDFDDVALCNKIGGCPNGSGDITQAILDACGKDFGVQ